MPLTVGLEIIGAVCSIHTLGTKLKVMKVKLTEYKYGTQQVYIGSVRVAEIDYGSNSITFYIKELGKTVYFDNTAEKDGILKELPNELMKILNN